MKWTLDRIPTKTDRIGFLLIAGPAFFALLFVLFFLLRLYLVGDNNKVIFLVLGLSPLLVLLTYILFQVIYGKPEKPKPVSVFVTGIVFTVLSGMVLLLWAIEENVGSVRLYPILMIFFMGLATTRSAWRKIKKT